MDDAHCSHRYSDPALIDASPLDPEKIRRALSDIDLNLLVALDALLKERNVTRAGQRLLVSQSTMSAALGRLRRLLDDPLLVRTGHEMRPTPLAESLAAPVAEILAKIEVTIGAARDFDPASDVRTFRIAASDYAVLVLIRPLMQALTRAAPNVQLQIRTTRQSDLALLLHRGEIDLAIVPEDLGRRVSMPVQTVLRDRFVAVVWRGNAEVGASLTLPQLRRLPYLGYRAGDKASMADGLLYDGDPKSSPAAVVDSFLLGAHMIRGTQHVTLLQERLAQLFEESAELRLLDPPITTPPLAEVMTWHPRATHDPAHQWLRDQIGHATADGPW